MPPLPLFCAPSGQAPSVAAACDRTINLLLEPLSNKQDQYVLYSAPGLRPVALLPSAPIRGLFTTSTQRVFAFTSTTIFELSSGFSYLSRGTIPTGTGPISASDNGFHMVFSVEGQGRIYDLQANTLAALPTTGPQTWGHFGYLDGYMLCNEPGTRRFWYSELLNAAVWPALAFYSAEARPDLVTSLVVDHRQVIVFGTQSIEIFNSTGDALSPFARMQAAAIEQGCEAPWSVAALDSTIFWLGGSPRGFGPLYMLQGYEPVRVSNYAVETALRRMSTVADARAFVLRQGGHAFYGLDLPSGQETWLFDTVTGAWVEIPRLLDDGSLAGYPCQVTTLAFGEHLFGDRTSGQLYVSDSDYHLYGTRPIYRERTTPHLRKEHDRVRYSKFGLMLEAGVGLDGGQIPGADPQVALSYSDDGGKTFCYPRWRSMGKIGAGAHQVTWHQLGQSRQRAFRIIITDPVRVALLGATVDVA